MKDVARNRKASHDYEIEDRVEAGLVLQGTEVKSLREGKAVLRDAYVTIRSGEAWMLNCHIAEYTHGNMQNHDPLRERKLLLHAREIEKLARATAQKGYSLIPLRIYFKGSHAKVEVGVGRGRKSFEKRHAVREREDKLEMVRALKDRNR
jgi:SsrA-binding protein